MLINHRGKLIKNDCFLNKDKIIEMNYSGDEFSNDGLYEFNKNIKFKDFLWKSWNRITYFIL